MKIVFFLTLLLCNFSASSQHKLPYNDQNKDGGTYLLRVNTLSDKLDDSATIYVKIFSLTTNGTWPIDSGTILIKNKSFNLIKESDEDILTPIRVLPGKFTISTQSYNWLLPLKTKKIKFKPGYYYSISFFLVRTYSFEE